MTDGEREAIEADVSRVRTVRELFGLTDEEMGAIGRRLDAEAAKAALNDVERHGTVSWDQIKADLGLRDVRQGRVALQ